MKVDQLELGQSVPFLKSDISTTAENQKKMCFYSFISLCQIESQKIRVLSLLASLYSLFQNMFISFWPHLDLTNKVIADKYDYIRTPPTFEENLTNAFFLYSTDRTPNELYMISFIIFFFSIFFFFLSLFCFFIFIFKRIVNFNLILCFNFFVQFVCPIIMVPIGFQTGWLISKVVHMKELARNNKLTDDLGSINVFTALIILNVFLYLILILVMIYNNFFNSNSIIIVDPHFVLYDSSFQSFFKIVPSFILFLSNILPLFHRKTCYFIASLHMAYCICIAMWTFWLPYGKSFANSVLSSASLSMLVSDVICFTKLNTKWYRYLIFIGCFIVFFFLMKFFIKLRIRFILKQKKTQKEKEQNQDDDQKIERFKSHNKPKYARFQPFGDPEIPISGFENLPVSKLLFALRVALMTKNQLFLDGNLIDFISSKIETDEEKINLSCLICYFPDFQPIFFSFLTSLKRVRSLSIGLGFRLYQLRCFDACCHPDSRVDDLTELINESSSLSQYLRSHWLIIDSKSSEIEATLSNNQKKEINFKMKSSLFASFDRLSQCIFNCHNKWKSLICFYPNNINVSSEYCKFLIECCGDFIKASEWKTISVLLNEDLTFKFNPAHVSFLRAYPNYAKLIYPKKTVIKNLDDIDFHNKIDNIGNEIEMPEARFEFQRSMNASYPISIYVFLFISIISLCFIFIFWIKGICTFGHFDHIRESLYFIVNIAFLAQQISKNLINAIMDYGQLPSYRLFPTPDEIFSAIYENNESDRFDKRTARSLLQLNGIYSTQLAAVSERGMGLVDYLHNSTLEQIEKGNKFQIVLDVFYNSTLESTYYLSRDDPVTSKSNLQSLIISFFTYYFTMSYDLNHSYVNDTEFYHATMAGSVSLDQVDFISQSILHNNQLLLDDADFKFSTQIYILSAIYVVFSCLFVWIDFYFITRNFRNNCNSLCYFPKNVRLKAADLLIKSNSNTDEANIISSLPKLQNVIFILLLVSTLIDLFLGGSIFSFHFVYEKYKNQFVAISHQVHYYSLETSQVIEVLYSVMAGAVFGQIVPIVDQTYKNRISQTLNKFVTSHQACGNLSYERDCGLLPEYVEIMNNLKNLEKCPDWENRSFHEYISCLSEESMVNTFIDLTKTLEANKENRLLLHTDIFKQYIHFVLAHVYYDVRNFGNYLVLGSQSKQTEYIKYIEIVGSMSIVISFLVFILNIYIFIRFRRVFRLFYAFISRVLPSDLVLNTNLMGTLLGIKNSNKKTIENEETSFLVQESSSPIAFLDRATSIEFVNNAFTTTFGYEANFIVGQPITTLIEDESALFIIDTMKFFGSREISAKTIKCKKGNGNSAFFDVTFIPINSASKDKKKHEIEISNKNNNKNEIINNNNNNNEIVDEDESKDNFIHRIALVFVDKTTEINLSKKCNSTSIINEKIVNSVYPPSFRLYVERYLKMCAICLIKIPNAFKSGTPTEKVLAERANVYSILYEKLQIYPLLSPFDTKNGIFAAVGCKKNDPTELAIECLNFVFTIIDELAGLITINSSKHSFALSNQCFYAVVETGGEMIVNWSGDETKKSIITGELIERALKVLDNAKLAGTVCVSRKTYQFIMQHDYSFVEKDINEEICGCNIIYSIENSPSDESSDRDQLNLNDLNSK